MASKFQIFVSSTFGDLEKERSLVIKAILEMGHIPVGMEMFSAADEEQWNIIKNQIDASDYYVVIAAHRYGSTLPDGTGYTEKEYDYAVSCGIPSLGFILDDSIEWPKGKSEATELGQKKIYDFKQKIKKKPVSFWRNQDDLYGKCSIALMKAFTAYPREGWVRASTVQDVASSKELVRLSAENAIFREQIAVLEAEKNKEKQFDKIASILKGNIKMIYVHKKDAEDWEPTTPLSLFDIFESIAPELLVGSELQAVARFIANVTCNVKYEELRDLWPMPRNVTRNLLADYAAFGLIRPTTDKPVQEGLEYWALSAYGAEYLAYIRRGQLEREFSKKEDGGLKLLT
ncbi:DUF4062 domain-containing protein [Paraburkholderia aspalathi]|uniref:DUF4062 domain-containing protein n=1 Tax=Paraburkholderia aspalathi TaxID=1324617 RepID=UPI0038B73F45